MDRAKWNYTIDVVLFVLMAAVLFIGILLGFVTAEGPVADHSRKYFWGLHRHQWGDIHLWLSIALVVFVVIHVILHWNWIKGCTKRLLRSTGALLGILALPVLVIAVVWGMSEKDAVEYQRFGVRAGPQHEPRYLLHSSPDRQEPGSVGEQHNQSQNRDEAGSDKLQPEHARNEPRKVEINGRMSLAEVERRTGVTVRSIAEAIGLPASVSPGTNLGRLRREHGFTIDQVRDAVNRLSGGKVLAVDSDEATHNAPPGSSPGADVTNPSAATSTAGRGQGMGGGRGQGMGGGRGQGMGGGRGQGLGAGRGQGMDAGRGVGQGAGRGAGQGLGRAGGGGAGLRQQPINGRLSLAEIGQMTGVSARALAGRLGLPAGVSLTERLGPLRRQYGFSMQDVRAAVAALKNQ